MSEDICEYLDCDQPAENEVELRWGELRRVCPEHVDRIEDRTGYCSASCMLGHGCDDSC